VELGVLRLALLRNVFSFCKFFDSSLDDAHTEYYYMEREWRVLDTIKFKLSDVHRVILPRRYSKRFRQDVPGYKGKVTPSDRHRRGVDHRCQITKG
jgi:hypothetical protein